MGVEYMQQQDPDLQNIDPEQLKQLISESNEQDQNLFQSNDMVKIIQEYLHVDLPEELKEHEMVKSFWAVLSRDPKLTFIENESEIEDFELMFNDSLYNYLMEKPTYEFSFREMQLLDQFRLYFMAAVRRAKGVPKHKFNERIIQGGTVNQTIKSNTESYEMPQKKGGIMGALSKFF